MVILIYIAGLVVFYLIGTKWIERKHYQSIQEREKEFLSFPVVSQELPEVAIDKSWLVYGSTVISVDVFKRFVGGLVNIFGGRLTTYESVLDRARREAILRMIEKSKNENADGIINLRIETSSISKDQRRNKIGSVEILAYGTAIKYSQNT